MLQPPSPPPKPTATKRETLETLDLNSELREQYDNANELLKQARLSGDDIPLNQLAQLTNSCVAILQSIKKAQEELYNLDRMKATEHALIETLKLYPSLQKEFLKTYQENLEKLWEPT